MFDGYASQERYHDQVVQAQSLANRLSFQFGAFPSYKQVMEYLYGVPIHQLPNNIPLERFAAMVVQSPNINLFEDSNH